MCAAICCGRKLSFEITPTSIYGSQKIKTIQIFSWMSTYPLTYLSATKVRLRNIFLAFDQGGEFCLFSARHGPSSRARRGLGSRMTWTSMQKKTPKETWPRFRMHATQQNFGIIIYPCAHMKILLWHTVSCLLLIAVVVQVAVVKITKSLLKRPFWAMAGQWLPHWSIPSIPIKSGSWRSD